MVFIGDHFAKVRCKKINYCKIVLKTTRLFSTDFSERLNFKINLKSSQKGFVYFLKGQLLFLIKVYYVVYTSLIGRQLKEFII
tara:strand:+ start:7825 stop:8073 length:249 start_codon:yes stop_codon:yes gene_type:complete